MYYNVHVFNGIELFSWGIQFLHCFLFVCLFLPFQIQRCLNSIFHFIVHNSLHTLITLSISKNVPELLNHFSLLRYFLSVLTDGS